MEGNRNVFRVYFPTECLRESSSRAIGCIDQVNRFCCVTGLDHSSNCPSSETSDEVRVVAIWTNSADSDAVLSETGCPEDMRSNDCSRNNILLCIEKRKDGLSVQWHPHTRAYKKIDCSIVLILYESSSFLASTTLSEMMLKTDPAANHESTNAEIILGSLAKQRNFDNFFRYKEQSEFYDPAQRQKTTIFHFVTEAVLMLPNYVVARIILKMSLWLSNLRFFRIPIVKKVLQMPSTLQQIEQRFGSNLVDAAALSKNDPPLPSVNVRFENSKYRLLLDVFLGVCLMSWLWSSDVIGIYADRFITWAEVVAVEFDSLLNWLMGAPAGLKLNEPFAYFLGNFFRYHIFVWKGVEFNCLAAMQGARIFLPLILAVTSAERKAELTFSAHLRTLRPIWSDICYYSCLSGCLGLTVQLSLLQDLISMMTIHIYCFYVYAARLYSLQVQTLSSLWRLFCGKKWNVLRKRVDSASYDIDQLFAGTLLFTILLFTLPTTALFYIVFALLRLMVLSLQGVLMTAVSLMNRVPVYWLFLRMVRPEAVSGHLHISIVQNNPLCVHLQLRPLSALELFKMSGKMAADATSPNNTWFGLGKKLLLGHLIYPWIERPSSN